MYHRIEGDRRSTVYESFNGLFMEMNLRPTVDKKKLSFDEKENLHIWIDLNSIYVIISMQWISLNQHAKWMEYSVAMPADISSADIFI